MALVLPLLLVLLIGTLDLAIALNAYVTVTSSSREGAHYAAAHPSAAPADIASAVLGRSVPLVASRVSVTASYHDGATFQPWPAGGIPSSSPSATEVPIRVEVTYPWSASTVMVGAFLGSNAFSFSARSTMVTRW